VTPLHDRYDSWSKLKFGGPRVMPRLVANAKRLHRITGSTTFGGAGGANGWQGDGWRVSADAGLEFKAVENYDVWAGLQA